MHVKERLVDSLITVDTIQDLRTEFCVQIIFVKKDDSVELVKICYRGGLVNVGTTNLGNDRVK